MWKPVVAGVADAAGPCVRRFCAFGFHVLGPAVGFGLRAKGPGLLRVAFFPNPHLPADADISIIIPGNDDCHATHCFL